MGDAKGIAMGRVAPDAGRESGRVGQHFYNQLQGHLQGGRGG